MFPIYSKAVARQLCKRGHRIVKTDINNNKPWLNVFLFQESEEIRKDFKEIVEGNKNGRE